MKDFGILVATVAILSCFCCPVFATDRLVPSQYPTIQEAIDAAIGGDMVIIDPNTYTGTGNRDLDFSNGLPSGQTRAITVRSTNPNDPNVVAATVIDCQNSVRGFYFHNNETASSVVDGLTITNGTGLKGGAIYCDSSSPTITRCTLTANSASRGGAIGAEGGAAPTINNNVVTNNSSSGKGGAIYTCDDGSITISNNVIADNSSNDQGGAIYCEGSYGSAVDIIITNNIIRDNSSEEEGGGVCCYKPSCKALVTDNIISDNLAGSEGGGIVLAMASSESKIANNIITGNSASSGGGVSCSNRAVAIINNIITNNTVAAEGSYGGGGIYCRNSDAVLTNNTITDNSEVGGYYGGGGILFEECDPTVTNCILWGNMAEAHGPQISAVYGSTLTIFHSDVQNGEPEVYVEQGSSLSWDLTNIETDPCFAFVDDYHLITESPCIDTGTNSPTAGLPTTDLDGNPRSLDGDQSGGAVADMGAYEFNQDSPSIALSPSVFEFNAHEDAPNPDGQILYIRNCGGMTLNWEVSDCSWLEVLPNTGSSIGEIDKATLRIDVGSIHAGNYEAELMVYDNGVVNSPRVFKIELHLSGTFYVPSHYDTIQSAIDATWDGDEVEVAEGTHIGSGNRDIDFNGKAITVRSTTPDNPAVAAATIIDCNGTEATPHRGFYFHNDEDANSIVDGLTIINGFAENDGGGIYCYESSPEIRNCVVRDCNAIYGGGICFEGNNSVINGCSITGNMAEYGGGILCSLNEPTIANCIISGNSSSEGGGGIFCDQSNTAIVNCLISGNSDTGAGWLAGGGGISCYDATPTVRNCTIVGNTTSTYGGGIISCFEADPNVVNTILWANNATIDGPQIALLSDDGFSPSDITISYSDVEGDEEEVYIETDCILNWCAGNIDADPCFADMSSPDPNKWDCHLQSQVGRWDPNANSWIMDANKSLCIDAGDPDSDWTAELWPHGKHINIGAYGSTPQASMSLSEIGNIADLSNNDIIDYTDLMLLVDKWLWQQPLLSEDIDRNGIVNFTDFAIFAKNFGWEEVVNFYDFSLDTDPGWSTEEEWAFGQPAGLGGSAHGYADPTSGYTGTNVYGVNLTGDYSTAVGGPYHLTAGSFDCSFFDNVKLKFAQWLNIDWASYVGASVEVSNDGSSWNTVWEHTNDSEIVENSWQIMEYDISSTADGQATVYIRWSYEIIESDAYPYSGWNIDDIQVGEIP